MGSAETGKRAFTGQRLTDPVAVKEHTRLEPLDDRVWARGLLDVACDAMNDLRFVQVFGDNGAGEETINEADIVSTLEFDKTGEMLAVGDKGGRVVVFQKNDEKGDEADADASQRDLEQSAAPPARLLSTEYKFFAEFQSHEPEFDYLKSLEIEEKINKIRWCPPTCDSLFLLSANDKTVKLWKMRQRHLREYESSEDPNDIFPKSRVFETCMTTTVRRIFSNAHAYCINSVSLNSDGETFLSADDLRVNLWQLECASPAFNLIDIRPDSMEELSEVITAAEFHPEQCSNFVYSSSKGAVKMADMRSAALCDKHAKIFFEEEDPADRSFFSEVLASMSDVKFSPDARYLLTRDYMTLKVWDVNMESRPVRTMSIHDFLRPKLCDIYDNDLVFDKFECAFSGDGRHVVTGSYDNYFRVYEWETGRENVHQASRAPLFRRKTAKPRQEWKKKEPEENPDAVDFNKKVLHLAFHPQQKLLAIGALNNLYIYAAPETRPE